MLKRHDRADRSGPKKNPSLSSYTLTPREKRTYSAKAAAAATRAKNELPTLAPKTTAPLDGVDEEEEVDALVAEAVLRVLEAAVRPAEVMAAVELE